jgi:hypothetical protein
MKSKDILYSKGVNDECYTPNYAVTPILKYIPKNAVVWCPFDTQESEFVKEISKSNKVIFSHIDNGQDFYNYEPSEHWDIIVSNPPFTAKRRIFEWALSFNKPFALLMTLTIFNDKYPLHLFKEQNKQPQLLKFDKRIKFNNLNKITFQCGYVCCELLDNDFKLENL